MRRMPTYEYACKECGEHIDVRQSVNDDPLAVCPTCGGPLRKVFSPVGIAFKGSGFYRTDSRVQSKESTKSKTDAASSSDGKKDGASGDGGSKSDAKSDSKSKTDSTKSAPATKSDAKSA
jgi:putative FmdB family regulatory protein